MFWSRLCTGTALSKDVTVRSDCDPSTEGLCQWDRNIGVSSSECGDASGLPQQQDSGLDFPVAHHSASLAFWPRERLFSEKSNLKTWNKRPQA